MGYHFSGGSLQVRNSSPLQAVDDRDVEGVVKYLGSAKCQRDRQRLAALTKEEYSLDKAAQHLKRLLSIVH